MARKYTLRGVAASGPLPSSVSGPESLPVVESSNRSVLGAKRPKPGLVNCGISERKKNGTSEKTDKNSFLSYCYDEAPVVGFRMMKNDVVTVRAARYPEDLASRLEGAKRGKIEDLSMQSRRRLALVAGNSPVIFRSFVTVTYPANFPCDGKDVKRHLHALLSALRRKTGGMSYLWFLEFQRRGAPHLHLFLSTALPEPLSDLQRKTGRIRKTVRVHRPWQSWLSSRWFEIVNSGDEKHLRAGAAWEVIEKPDGAARYVSKEAYKTFQKVVPVGFQNVGRFWGCSRDVAPDDGEVVRCSQEDMKQIFPAESFDSEGRPYPVLFSAAESYRKIVETAKDPVKVRRWKMTRPLADIPLTNLSNSKTEESLHSASFAPSLSAKRKRGPNANREWHGSTLNNSNGSSDTSANRK